MIQTYNQLEYIWAKNNNTEFSKPIFWFFNWTKFSNVMIERRNVFDQQIENDIKTYENIKKIPTSQGDDLFQKTLSNDNLMLIQKQYNKLILLEI